eukprot:scaffold64764_cov66-Phaeocystis_antarctica.AAC.10
MMLDSIQARILFLKIEPEGRIRPEPREVEGVCDVPRRHRQVLASEAHRFDDGDDRRVVRWPTQRLHEQARQLGWRELSAWLLRQQVDSQRPRDHYEIERGWGDGNRIALPPWHLRLGQAGQ